MGFARSAGRVYGQARKTWRKPKPKEREYSAQDFSGKDNLVNLRARKNDRTYELLVDDKDVYVAYDDQKQGKTRYKKAMSVGGFTSINPGKPGPQKQWAKTYQGSGGEFFGFDAVAKHLKDTGYDFQVLDKRPMKMRERTRKGDMPDIFGDYIDPRRAHNTSESYYRDSNFKNYRPESLDEKIEIVKKWRKEQKNPKKPKMADVPDDSAKQPTQDSQPGVNPNGIKTKARPWRHPSDQNPGPGWEDEIIDVVAEDPIRKNTMGGPLDVNSIAYQNAMKALNGPRKAIGSSGNADKNTTEIGDTDPLKQLGVNKPAAEIETYTPNWQASLKKAKSPKVGRKAWRKKAERQIEQARANTQLPETKQTSSGEMPQLGYTPVKKAIEDLADADRQLAELFKNLETPAHGGQNQKNLATENQMWRKRVENIGQNLVESAKSGMPLPYQTDDQTIKDAEGYYGGIVEKHRKNDPDLKNPTKEVKHALEVLSVVKRNTTQAAIGNIPQNVVNDITVYQGKKVRGEGVTEGQIRSEGFDALIDGLKSQATQEKDKSVIEALLKKASDLEKQQRQFQLSKDMKTGQVEDSPLTNADILNMADPQGILTQSREYPDPDLEIADIGEATDLSVDPLAEDDARAAQGRQKIFTSTVNNPVDPKTIDAYNVMSGQFATNKEDVAFPARTMQLPSLYKDPFGGLGDRYEQLSNRSDEQQFENFLSGKGPEPGRFNYNVGQPELQPEGDYTPEQKIANQVAARLAGVAGEARSRKMIQEGYRLGLEQGDNSPFVFNEGVLNKSLGGSERDVSKQESKAFDDIYQSVMNHLGSNPELMQNIAGLPPKQQEAASRQLIGDIVDQILNESANSTIEDIKRSQILSGTTNATSEDIQNAIQQNTSGNFGSKYLSNLLKKSEHASSIVGELRQQIDEARANGESVLDAIDSYFNGDPAARNIAQANSDFAESTDNFNRRFAENLIQDDPQSLDAQNLASVLGINITPKQLPSEELSTAEIEMDLDPAILNDVTGMSEIYVVELPDDIDSELYSDGSVGAANDINYSVVSRNEDTGVVTRDQAVYDNIGKDSIIVRNGAEFVITDANNPTDQKIVRLDSQPDLFQKLVSLTGVSTRVKNPVTYTDGPTHEANVTGEELEQNAISSQRDNSNVQFSRGLGRRIQRPVETIPDTNLFNDDEYLNAIANGDMDLARKLFDEAARSQGFTVEGYHGLAQGELIGGEFNSDFLGSNTGAASAREGFFFGSQDTARSYAQKTLNPESASDITQAAQNIVNPFLRKIPEGISPELDFLRSLDEPFAPQSTDEYDSDSFVDSTYNYVDSILNEIEYRTEDLDNYDEIREMIDQARSQLDSGIGGIDFTSVTDVAKVDALLKMENPYTHDFKGSKYRDETYYDIIQKAKDLGHDSVLLQNTYDGAGLDDIKVVFNPNQIINNNPVEFDENGNPIPLSKRFWRRNRPQS